MSAQTGPTKSRPETLGLPEQLSRPALWLAVLVLVLAIVFYLLDIKSSWDSPTLTLWLNIVLVVIPCFFITVTAARGFLYSGSWPVLSLGTGAVSYGLAALLSMWMRTWAPVGASQAVFALAYLAAGLFYFLGAFFALNRVSPQPPSGRLAIVLQVYLILFAFISFAAIVSIQGVLPPFFVQGVGSTPLRNFVQGIAIVLFLAAGFMIFIRSQKPKSVFLQWYGLALLLAVLNTIGVLLVVNTGTPFHWVLTISQLLGGVYLFMAAVTIMGESKTRQIPTGEVIAGQLATTEARLKESEQKYRDLFVHMTEGFALCDIVTDSNGKPVDYRVLEANQAWEELTGLSISKIVGKPLREQIPSLEQYWVDNYGKVALTGEPLHLENYNKFTDRWYEIYAYSPGKGYFVSLVQNITKRKKTEEEILSLMASIQQERDKLSALVNSIPDEVWFANLEKNFTLANPSALREFGLASGNEIDVEALAKSLEVYRPDGSPRPLEETPPLRALQGQIIRNQEEIIRTPATGEFRYRRVSAAPVKDANGNIVGSVSVVRDITDLKQAEESLRQREAVLEAFFANSPGILNIEDEEYRYIKTDKLTPTYFNLDRQAIVGKAVGDLAPDFVREFGPMMRRVIETGKPELNLEVKNPVPNKPGEFTYWQASYFPIPLADGKRGIGIMGVEITNLKKAEEALKESEERFRTLANSIPQLAWVADEKGWLFWYNQRWYDYTGTDLEEMKGWGWQKVHHPDYVQPVTEKFKHHVATGEAWEDTFPLRGKDGNYRWFLSRAFPIRDAQGKVTRWFGTNTDITETLKAEDDLKRYTSELEAANKELESFSYSVSHDLRAPLRGIDGFSNALLEDYADKLDEQGKDYLNRVRKSTQQMSELIDGMLVLSRVSRAEIHPETVHLSDLARLIIEDIKKSQPDRNVEFLVSEEVKAVGDKALLESLLRNLLENAWKFTSKRTQTRIEFGANHQDGRTTYYIKDNGVGFDMKYAGKLFRPFTRLHTDTDYPGTGIGLANVQKIVRRHNGQIWAESELGKGTTFYFTLGNSPLKG